MQILDPAGMVFTIILILYCLINILVKIGGSNFYEKFTVITVIKILFEERMIRNCDIEFTVEFTVIGIII